MRLTKQVSGWMRWAGALGVMAALIGAPVPTTFAQTITVTTTLPGTGGGGDCSLLEAIQAANTDLAVDACAQGVGPDVVVLQSSATYTLTTASEVDPQDGPSAFAITSTLTIDGNGSMLVTDLAPFESLRLFRVITGADLTLQDLILNAGTMLGITGTTPITAGAAGGPGGLGRGGAILNFADLTLDGVSLLSNVARGGRGGQGADGLAGPGGMGGLGGLGAGSAIYNTGQLHLNSVQFAGNITEGGVGGNGGMGTGLSGGAGNYGGAALGGAVFSLGTLSVGPRGATFFLNLAQGGMGGAGGFGSPGGAGGPASAGMGGAIYNAGVMPAGGPLYVEDNTARGVIGGSDGSFIFRGASSRGMGGGLYNDSGDAALVEARFIDNLAQGGGGIMITDFPADALGGGIFNEGDLVLTRTALLSNTALAGNIPAMFTAGISYGGGLYTSKYPVSIAESLIAFNVALSQTALTPVGQGHGGGLYAEVSPLTVVNTTFSGNIAHGGNGGAMAIRNFYPLTLTHVTMFGNHALTGGGLSTTITTTLVSSLVISNTALNCAGPVVDGVTNFQFPGASCGAMPIANPLLEPLQDNGGPTLTHAIPLDSLAHDAAAAGSCPATDQRGVARPPAACDIGAFEFVLRLFLPLITR